MTAVLLCNVFLSWTNKVKAPRCDVAPEFGLMGTKNWVVFAEARGYARFRTRSRGAFHFSNISSSFTEHKVGSIGMAHTLSLVAREHHAWIVDVVPLQTTPD